MLSIGFAIAACVGWGVADFIGGLKSRKVPTLMVLIIANGTGMLLLWILLATWGQSLPLDAGLLWAVPAGFLGIIAMYLLYRSLAIGVMSVLAPVSATGALLPVIWGLLSGEVLSLTALTGLVSAFIGTILAAMEPVNGGISGRGVRGIHLALGAAVCIGLYFILMDRACMVDPLWASTLMRTISFLVLVPLICLNRRTPGYKNLCIASYLPLIIFMGVLDSMAAFSFTLATSSGLLSIAAVVSSLYPAVTVILGVLILKERIRGIQFAGVTLAMTGVVLVSVA